MYSLSCAKFHGNMTAGMLSMLESEEMANVTIAVEGKQMKAHQMVLSICSPYFKSLLLTNPCKHPIIFLKDVKYDIMKDLLRFMYEGQAHIDKEDLQLFINTAQALQIKWLTNNHQENDHNAVQEATLSNSDTMKRIHEEDRSKGPKDPQELVKLLKTSSQTELNEANQNKKQKLCNKNSNPDTQQERNELIACKTEITDPEKVTVKLEQGIEAYCEIEDDECMEQTATILQEEQQEQELTLNDERPPDGRPVTVQFIKYRNNEQVIVNHHRYSKKYLGRFWKTWRCRSGDDSCKAYVHLTNDDHVIFRNQHSHAPARTPRLMENLYDKTYTVVSLTEFLSNTDKTI